MSFRIKNITPHSGDVGFGHDIEIVEDETVNYIEVKTTKEENRDWVLLSRRQWELAQETGDRFFVYRIYNAGLKHARLSIVQNPFKLWQEGKLPAHVRIRL